MMKASSNILLSAVLLLTFVHFSVSDRILFLLPVASRSHVNVFEPLVRALGERGHDVVNLSPVKSPNMPATVTQMQILTIEETFGELANPFEMRKMGMLQSLVNGSFDTLTSACRKILHTDTFQNLVTKEKFDVVIVDILMNYCVLGAVPIIEAPTILVSTFAAPSFLSVAIGNRLPPSFVADPFLDLTHKMNFIQRLKNVIFGGLSNVICENVFIKPSEKTYREILPNGKDLPGIHEIQANTSMIFMNSHFTLTYPRPMLPDCVEVGGMHTRPARPLPQDIEDFLKDSAEDGFIIFSLGSIVPAKLMPEEYRKIFVRVFSRLKQRVLWKWETETMPDVPPNVMLRKFLPQQDILGHPHVKLFMTHGGLLSTQEAAYHGVPLLGLPLFGDQDLNIKQAEAAGYAIFFEILDLTENKLENAILEMLNNTIYSEKAKELSARVRDLPQTPLEKAVFWTEYVLRHKGATHLRSAARDLNFFQYYVLDVAFAIIIATSITLYVYYVTAKAIFRMVCRRKSTNLKKLQ